LGSAAGDFHDGDFRCDLVATPRVLGKTIDMPPPMRRTHSGYLERCESVAQSDDEIFWRIVTVEPVGKGYLEHGHLRRARVR
jgi:hypothetical protein